MRKRKIVAHHKMGCCRSRRDLERPAAGDVRARAGRLRLLVIDVDGTLTDAGIYYDEHGNELKKFCTRDAAGFFAAHAIGIKTMVLTGRECAATGRRMAEMKASYLYQDVTDKQGFLKKFMDENGLSREDVGYIGDDLNDIAAMKFCGFIGCPADSCQEVKEISHYVSPVCGGYGAVRDVIEYLLNGTGEWDSAVSSIYDSGI